MKNKKNQGITLIALIITVIVMLILVAVTIQVVISSGLLSSASKAGKDYQAAAEEEANMSKVNINNKEYNSIEEYVGTKPQEPETPTPKPKVGDYVNYTPETGTYKVGSDATGYTGTDAPDPQAFTTQTGDNSLRWRIISTDEKTGKIELVAATQTTDVIYFEGATGYNHCVDILNDMCLDLYSNDSIGATARSIKIEDIQAKTTYDFNSYVANDGRKYGLSKYQMTSYSETYRKRPNLYIREQGSTSAGLNATGLKTGSQGLNNRVKNGTTGISTYADATIDANGGYADANTNTYATLTYVYYAPESYLRIDLKENNPVIEIFNTETTYWLASRCVNANSGRARFELRAINASGFVSSANLLSSFDSPESYGLAVRPVISLPSTVNLTVASIDEATGVTTWNI